MSAGAARVRAGALPRGSPRTRACAVALPLALAVALAQAAAAQEFEPAAPPAVALGVATLLDLGLPAPARATEVASVAARPYGLETLDRVALGGGFGTGSFRGAAGVARWGDVGLGWNALGAAAGWSRPGAGAALRGAVRRDRDRPGAGPRLDADAIGGEAGAGAWLVPARGWRAWVAHPQLWTRGAAPPLRRGLECGVAWRARGGAAWLVHESPARDHDDDAHRLGVALTAPGVALWAEGCDAPLRAALGIRARAGRVRVGARIDEHPELPESVTLEIVFGAGAADVVEPAPDTARRRPARRGANQRSEAPRSEAPRGEARWGEAPRSETP